MKRIRRDELESRINIKLRLVPNHVRQRFAAKLTALRDEAAALLAAVVLDELESTYVRSYESGLVRPGDHGAELRKFTPEDDIDDLTLVHRLRHLTDAELKTAYQHAEAAGHDRIADACAEEMARRALED